MAAVDAAIVSGWQWVVDHTSEFERVALGPMVPSLAVFWIGNAILMFFHFFPALSPIEQYKIQKHQREKGPRVLVMLINAIFNQALIVALGLLTWEKTAERQLSGMEGIPSWSTLVFQLVACMLLYDFMFFAIHRLFHIPFLYRHIHSVHHSSRASIGITQSFFHPIEFLASAPAVILPPLLVSNHVITQCVWSFIFMIESLNAHSGYNLPFLPDTRIHDFHHSHPHIPSNYGAFFSIPDILFGCDVPYRRWLADKEERVKKEQQEKSQ